MAGRTPRAGIFLGRSRMASDVGGYGQLMNGGGTAEASRLWLPDTNFLTFDIEEWYHVTYKNFDAQAHSRGPDTLEALVDRLIDLCAEHGVRTTCFVLGSVGVKTPAVVKKLQAAGHEIASHGSDHENVFEMTPERFRTDLKASCEVLEDITGEKVIGFRAPAFSVKRENLRWFYPVLEDLGLRYSSSVFPGETFLYGIPGFPEYPHRPVLEGVRQGIVEFPMPRIRLFNKDLGLYLRFFPAWMIRRAMATRNRAGIPGILYVHPREIDIRQTRLPLPFFQSLIHYWGIRTCERKLFSLMANPPGKFSTFRDCLRSQNTSTESKST